MAGKLCVASIALAVFVVATAQAQRVKMRINLTGRFHGHEKNVNRQRPLSASVTSTAACKQMSVARFGPPHRRRNAENESSRSLALRSIRNMMRRSHPLGAHAGFGCSRQIKGRFAGVAFRDRLQ